MTGNPKDSEWYSTPASARKRHATNLTLSDEALERLKRMAKARKLSRSLVVEALIQTSPIRCSAPEVCPACGDGPWVETFTKRSSSRRCKACGHTWRPAF